MVAKQKDTLKGAAIALLLAGGMGASRLIEGAQRSLQKISSIVAANVADLRAMADATHEEAMNDAFISDVKQK